MEQDSSWSETTGRQGGVGGWVAIALIEVNMKGVFLGSSAVIPVLSSDPVCY